MHVRGTSKKAISTSQSYLKKVTTESITNRITDLEVECSKLLREKEELRKLNEAQRQELIKMNEKCSQPR